MSHRLEKRRIRLVRLLSSKELASGIVVSLCFILACTTFVDERDAFTWLVIRILFFFMVIQLSVCTIQKVRSLSVPVLIMHTGVIVTIIGGGISSYGFVATVNVYEGTYTDRVFRWDLQREVSLGIDIMVEKLHERYYPVQVQVGVLKEGVKSGLFTLKTGEHFILDDYQIYAESIDPYRRKLSVVVTKDGRNIGRADTRGASDLPPEFPYSFRLVAFRDPLVQSSRVDLKLLNATGVIAEGSATVNHPLHWNGLYLYHTATDVDVYGTPYVGLQITRDPGRLYVYAGFSIFSLGGISYLFQRVRKKSKGMYPEDDRPLSFGTNTGEEEP